MESFYKQNFTTLSTQISKCIFRLFTRRRRLFLPAPSIFTSIHASNQATNVQRSAKTLFLGCVTRLWGRGKRGTQPRKDFWPISVHYAAAADADPLFALGCLLACLLCLLTVGLAPLNISKLCLAALPRPKIRYSDKS